MPCDQFPIKTPEDLYAHWEEFRDYMHHERTYEKTEPKHPQKFSRDATNHRIRGAEIFVQFLCGEPIEKR